MTDSEYVRPPKDEMSSNVRGIALVYTLLVFHFPVLK